MLYKIAFSEDEQGMLENALQYYMDHAVLPEERHPTWALLFDKVENAVASPDPQENLKLGMGPRDGRA
jgi:hypothetical protein